MLIVMIPGALFDYENLLSWKPLSLLMYVIKSFGQNRMFWYIVDLFLTGYQTCNQELLFCCFRNQPTRLWQSNLSSITWKTSPIPHEISRGKMFYWRLVSISVALLALTHLTEMHGKLVFHIVWCCQLHWMGHGQHFNLKWIWMDWLMDGWMNVVNSLRQSDA